MELRHAPLPRMAGDLTFMRAPRGRIEDLEPDSLAILGAPFEAAAGARAGQRLGPRILRETSVYFGWHANPQFSHPIDIDARRNIDTSSIHGRLVDLGDAPVSDRPPDAAMAALTGCVDGILGRGAGVIVLGGDAVTGEAASGARPMVRIGGEVTGREALALAPAAPVRIEAAERLRQTGGLMLGIGGLCDRSARDVTRLTRDAGRPFVHLDLSALSAPLHGMSPTPRLAGLTARQLYELLVAIGRAPVSGLAVTGLDPTLNGLSIVKTGARLLVTVLLGFTYGRMGLLDEELAG